MIIKAFERALSLLGALVGSMMLSGCTDGVVSVAALSLKIDGIVVEDGKSEVSVPSILNFSVTGTCANDMDKIFYRVRGQTEWSRIDDSIGSVNCTTEGTYSLRYNETVEKIQTLPGFQKSPVPELTLELYAKSAAYPTNPIILIVKQAAVKPIVLEQGQVPNSLTQTPPLFFTSVNASSSRVWIRDEIRVIDKTTNQALIDWSAATSGNSLQGLTLVKGREYFFELRGVDVFGNIGATVTGESWVARDNPVIPTFTSTITRGATSSGLIPIRVTFSEPVSGFELADLAIENAYEPTELNSESLKVYTFSLTPKNQGAVRITLAEGRVVDGSGNANAAASFEIIYDSVNPTVASIVAKAWDEAQGKLIDLSDPTGKIPNANNAVTVLVTFNEPVQDFDPNDIVLENATLISGSVKQSSPVGGNAAALHAACVPIDTQWRGSIFSEHQRGSCKRSK